VCFVVVSVVALTSLASPTGPLLPSLRRRCRHAVPCAVVTRRCRDAAAWYVARVCRCITAMCVYGVTVSAAAVVSSVCGWGDVQ
jgi:hypothetical protein